MKLFLTDGIRGTNVATLCRTGYRLGYAQKGKNKVVLGCDNRPSSPEIASFVAKGLLDAETDVLYAGVVPTPVVQWATAFYVADAGVVVTASHNSGDYNGLKYVGCTGEKPREDELAALERAMEEAPEPTGRSTPPLNAGIAKAYCDCLNPPPFAGLKLAVDCANGAAYSVAKRVFAKTETQVTYLHHGDGKHVNRDCGALYPASLRETVLGEGLDLGVAFDGDGDRCIAVTKAGRVLDGDAILYALCRDKRETCAKTGAVGTVLSNGALSKALHELGVKLYCSDVGDGNVLAAMRRYGATLGAEPSGHVLAGTPYADGLRTALLLCDVACRRDLDEWVAPYRPYPQVRVDCPKGAHTLALAQKLGNKWQDYLGKTGRVVVRESGTEPVVRVMVECEDQALAETVADSIRRSVVKPRNN